MQNWLKENAAALIGHALTFLGLVAAACTVAWQMRRQHTSSLALQRENARDALKLRIYETLAQRIRTVSDALIEAKIYTMLILQALDGSKRSQNAGYGPVPINQRVPEFSRLHREAMRQVAELVVDLESWSIAVPGIRVFRVAMSSSAHDVREAFTPLHSALIDVLPMEPPSGQTDKSTIVYPLPTQEKFSMLELMIDKYGAAMGEIECYVQDLTVEAQNNLLHGLFEERVPPRLPLDPKHKVISTAPDKAPELIRYFETESPWGKSLSAANERARADVAARTTPRAQ